MSAGVLARSLYLVSRSETCRQVTAYWIFTLSVLLIIDILMLPLLEGLTNMIALTSYVLIRSLTFIILSFEPVASRVAYRIRINLDMLKALGESEEYERLSNAIVVTSIMIMMLIIVLLVVFSEYLRGAVAFELILIGIVLLNVALDAILIRPKFLAFVAAVSASLAAIYAIMIPFLYGELSASMMSLILVCSDAFAILGLNVAGVPTCLDATKSSES